MQMNGMFGISRRVEHRLRSVIRNVEGLRDATSLMSKFFVLLSREDDFLQAGDGRLQNEIQTHRYHI